MTQYLTEGDLRALHATNHHVSASCEGEICGPCFREWKVRCPARHKLVEEIPYGDPNPIRDELTQYVCCEHFRLIVGGAAPCRPGRFPGSYVP
jgi:hypothetical protein